MLNIYLDILKNVYTYNDLKDTLDLKRIAIYTKNDERGLQEMVCKDFLEDNTCVFNSINIYKDNRKGTNIHSKIMEQLLEDIKNNKIDTIVCSSLDRLTSSIVELTYILELLNQNNVRLLSLH